MSLFLIGCSHICVSGRSKRIRSSTYSPTERYLVHLEIVFVLASFVSWIGLNSPGNFYGSVIEANDDDEEELVNITAEVRYFK